MIDILERLRLMSTGQYREAADEIERLRARVETLERMDREAATHVESVICMKSNTFTGEPPYVGWKGLGLALEQDYAELKRLRELDEHVTQEGKPG